MRRQSSLILSICTVAIMAVGIGYRVVKLPAQVRSGLRRSVSLLSPHSVYAQGVTVLWSANMESNGDPGPDLGEWYKPACCTGSSDSGGGLFSSGMATGGPSFDFNHTPDGKYSAMLKISTPSTPTSGARLFRWAEPEAYPELYYSVWYYFPQRYNPSLFWNVMQWKSQHAGTESSDPFFSLEIGSLANGEMYFYLGNDQTNASYSQNPQTFVSIPVRRWVHVEAFYKCDGSGAGEVAISQDGAQLWDIRNVVTRYADGNCQWSVNNYSSGLTPGTATIYVDDASICLGGRCPGEERDH